MDAWDLDPCLTTMRRALFVLDCRLTANRLSLLAGTLGRFVARLVVERTGFGFGTATGADADRFRLQAQLYSAGGGAASLGLDPMLALVLLLRSLYPASRLGFSPEYVQVRSDVASILDIVGGPRLSGGGYARAVRAAVEIGDRAGAAFVLQTRKLIRYIAGRGSARDILADSADPERLISPGRFVTQLGGTLWVQLLAGFTRDAQTLYQEGVTRLEAADLPESSLVLAGASVAAAMGRVAEADAALGAVAGDPAAFRNPSRRVSLLLARPQVAVEQRDFGEPFDQVAADIGAAPEPEDTPGAAAGDLRIPRLRPPGTVPHRDAPAAELGAGHRQAGRRGVAGHRRVFAAAQSTLPAGRRLVAPPRR